MINLLPTKQKRELLEQERLRLLFILGALFLAFLLSFALILILVKSYFLQSIENERVLFKEREKIVSLYSDTETEITQANNLFSNILSVYKNQYKLTDTLEEVYRIFPNGTYLSGFNFTISQQVVNGVPKNLAKVALTGVCPTRDLLLQFKDSLQKQDNFANVYFSPNSWIEPINPNFNVSFELK